MNIINNFLEKNYFNKLKKMLHDQVFPWHYHNNMVNDKDEGYLSHCFFNNNKIYSNDFFMFEHLLDQLKVAALTQLRANLVLSKEKSFESAYHVDNPYKNCTTAILYFTTCNGKTIFKDRNITEIESQEYKIVIFDSQTEHKMVSQTNTPKRIVLNLSYFTGQ